MAQKGKELLMRDLSGRLFYGVKCYIPESNEVKILGGINEDGENTLFDFWEDSRKIICDTQLYISEFKPYLFPLSSMTQEQCVKFCQVSGLDADLDSIRQSKVYLIGDIAVDCLVDAIDWFNKNHFDYRELITCGLAIDATNLNIY